MARPMFHTETLTSLMHLADTLPHAIGLVGEKGMGLTTAALYLAEQATASIEIVYPERLDEVDIDKGTITIDVVRRLYRMTQGKSNQRRCIVITAADTMSPEAQNAFLKLLEEPTRNTSFVLLIHKKDQLLPTVQSRLQQYTVRFITPDQSEQLLDRLKVEDESRRRQLLFIAQGKPALLTKLTQDDSLFASEAELLRQARTFIQGSSYERLIVCHAVRDSRDKAIRMVQHAMTILQFDIKRRKHADVAIIDLLDRLEQASERLSANANIRLALARTVL